MALWTGCSCTSCGKPFTDTDDVVVCPDCGAPYHRDCYVKAGKCVFSDKHGTGFEYKRPADIIKKKCANCGAENDSDAKNCVKCGISLKTETENESSAEQTDATRHLYEPIPGYTNGDGDTVVIDVPKEIDGISAKDWAMYIGNSAPYYLLQFKQMDMLHRKTSFCWSALLFPPMYFLYRKMWKEGVLSSIIFFALSIPSFLYTFMSVGIKFNIPFTLSALDTMSLVANIVSWLLQIACGLFAFYLYRKSAIQRIKAIKQATQDSSACNDTLVVKGGTSKAAVVVLFAVIMIASMLLATWIGPDRIIALYYS